MSTSIIAVLQVPEKEITISFMTDKGSLTKTVRKSAFPDIFANIWRMLKNKESADTILGVFDAVGRIKSHSSGLFSVSDDGKTCYIGGEAVSKSVGDRILAFAQEGIDFARLVKFWENCQKNPDPRAKSDLFQFLEHNGHPITEDGCFVGYRSVRNDFMDKHTGTISNAIGNVVSMKREECDSDPNQTCSRGLHVAAFEYASGFGGGDDRLIDVKVNPKDVVAIPTDYNGQKMHVCEFTVLAENKEGLIKRQTYENRDAAVSGEEGELTDDMLKTENDDESGASSTESENYSDDTAQVVTASGWKGQTRLSNGRFGPKVI